ncbi:MAG: alanine racemase, partial [Candidatus Aminicenantales bacterium]
MNKHLLQWVEIDRSALFHNLREFRQLIGKHRLLLATVKANAYGHGISEISPLALEAGADWLGVHSVEEARLLRRRGVGCPVLVLGYVPLDGLREAVDLDVRLTVYNQETIDALARIGKSIEKKIRIHVKVETGTHRQGVSVEDLLPFVRRIQDYPSLFLEGLSSHFANIEDTTDHSYARYQVETFQRACQMLEEAGVHVPIKHMACSAAAILFPDTYFDMVRVGIGMYGLWPSKETYLSCILQTRPPVVLKPVLSWKARIAQIKHVAKGACIGYGCTYKTTRQTTLAVLPVGYYDGYSRALSNAAHVLVKGQRAPLLGRVAMNFIVVDITDIPDVKIEDEAVLIGVSGEE